jgi:hypothetical protein
MTVPRADVKQVIKEEAKRSRERWITSTGWQNRGRITWEQWNRHKKALDETQIEELAVVSTSSAFCAFSVSFLYLPYSAIVYNCFKSMSE